MRLFREAASVAAKPFIYLSAGVSDTVFRETLELAAEAGTSFASVLCGRAGWWGGVPAFAKGGPDALTAWLADQGVRDIKARNANSGGWSQDVVDSVRGQREYRGRCRKISGRRVSGVWR
jgi:tagatose-1,6-bisphosphate aldolase